MKINYKSLIRSGILTGVIINLSAIAMVPLLGNEMNVILASRGLPPLSDSAMLFFSSISFIFGISIVGLYALMKEHFGAGIKTAVISVLIFWFLKYFISNISLVAYGFMPLRFTLIGTFLGLIELLIAGIIGTRFYKEIDNTIKK